MMLSRGELMNAGIRTHICEPNIFARQWMAMLIARDWHTQLTSESATLEGLTETIEKETLGVLLVSTALCQNIRGLSTMLQSLTARRKPPMILWVGKPDYSITKLEIPHQLVAGYLAPDEIQQSLGWAVNFASKGNLVITPSGVDLMPYWERFGDRPLYELDGRKAFDRYRLSKKDQETARLAFLFSIERADMDDETNTQENTPQMQISRLYGKIGLEDIPEDSARLQEFFENDEIIIEHYQEIIAKRKGKLKKGNESLAFHVLTKPECKLVRGKAAPV